MQGQPLDLRRTGGAGRRAAAAVAADASAGAGPAYCDEGAWGVMGTQPKVVPPCRGVDGRQGVLCTLSDQPRPGS